MNRFSLPCWAAVAVLTALGLGSLTPAAYAGPFKVNGTATFESSHGNIDEGSLSGRAAPGGPFSGGYSQKVTAGGDILDGVALFDFGLGDTLTLRYHIEFDVALRLYVGSYAVIGGTGRLEGASGSGSLISERGATVAFQLSGTLNL